jgi:hypothetical protein
MNNYLCTHMYYIPFLLISLDEILPDSVHRSPSLCRDQISLGNRRRVAAQQHSMAGFTPPPPAAKISENTFRQAMSQCDCSLDGSKPILSFSKRTSQPELRFRLLIFFWFVPSSLPLSFITNTAYNLEHGDSFLYFAEHFVKFIRAQARD